MLKKALVTMILLGATSSYAATPAETPRVYVDTSMPSTTITKTVCASGCDYTNDQFQLALNDAQLGTTILLQQGFTYTPLDDRGFILPNKTSGTGWIIIKPAGADTILPPSGTRLTPSYSSVMPKIVRKAIGGLYAITCDTTAHHYRFIGIEMMNPGNVDTSIIGAAFVNCAPTQETTLALQNHHILFDRVYIHGPSAPGSIGVKFGLVLGGQHEGVIESTIEDITYDTDAIAVGNWAGAGPFVIRNNTLSSSGENIMFGGADPSIANLVPSDIEIRHNYIYKPLKWRDDPAYSTGTYRILAKNLLELKNAQRVLVDGNVFENMWPSAQPGYAMTFTPRQGSVRGSICDPNGCAPWTVVQDVTVTSNVIRSTANGIGISGKDGSTTTYPTLPGGRYLVSNNLFVNSGGYSGTGLIFDVCNAASDVQILHNTIASFNATDPSGSAFTLEAITTTGDVLQNLVIKDNIVLARYYPFKANINGSFAFSSAYLSTVAPGYVWTNVVGAGPWPSTGGVQISDMPQGNGNGYPLSESSIGYVNLAGGDYHLAANSPYKNAASDGKDVGVDWVMFNTAQDPANTALSTPSTTSTASTGTTSSPTTTITTSTTTTSTAPTTISSTSTTSTSSTSTTSTSSTSTTSTSTSMGKFLGKLKQLMDKVR